MNLGAFSLSLSVKDINASKEFYEKIGFKAFFGKIEDKWLIMQNDDCTIGLFQDMFEKNIFTFNPGWNSRGEEIDPFTDIRILKSNFKAEGIKLLSEVGTEDEGPASFIIEDPDGNQILFDQHR